MRTLKKSHSAEKCEGGTLLAFLTSKLVENIFKMEGAPSEVFKKIRDKVSQCRKH